MTAGAWSAGKVAIEGIESQWEKLGKVVVAHDGPTTQSPIAVNKDAIRCILVRYQLITERLDPETCN